MDRVFLGKLYHTAQWFSLQRGQEGVHMEMIMISIR